MNELINKLIKSPTSIISSILLGCCTLSNCSLFSSSTQLVTIESTTPEATIKVNGRIIGKGNATTTLKKNKTHTVTADFGNQHGMAVIDSQMSASGKLDIMGGVFFLFPFLGFINEGAWTLEPDYIRIDLQ